MLTFNLKKQWFDKIKSGEKTHEYREVKPYWTKRLFYQEPFRPDIDLSKYNDISIDCNWEENIRDTECEFVCGYAKKDDKEKRLKAKIKSIRIINGKNTDLAVDELVYDIEFELLED